MTEEKQNQYKTLIKARNYHYDNLNKWMMTFYVIIGALFLALWTLHASQVPHRHMELCVAIVGYVVSVGAVLSGKGYAYWEINWIQLVHHFEKINFKSKEDRVYSVYGNYDANNCLCCPVSGANVSTTKVALAITTFISVTWGTIAIYLGITLLAKLGVNTQCALFNVVLAFFGSCILTLALVVILGKCFKSHMKPLDNLGLTDENIDKPIIE